MPSLAGLRRHQVRRKREGRPQGQPRTLPRPLRRHRLPGRRLRRRSHLPGRQRRSSFRRAAKAKQFPEGFHPAIDGLGYRLEFGRDPVAGLDAYRVTVEGKDVGWLRREQEKRWVLYSTVDAFTESVHRNVLGAQARLETIYEPAD